MHFAAIGKVLHKIVLDVASVFPFYYVLEKTPKILNPQHPAKSKPQPLANNLNLLACMISGKTQEQLESSEH